MRGNIRVFCRARKDDRSECCLKFPTDQDIIANHPQQGKKMFNFDKVFSPTSTQEQVSHDLGHFEIRSTFVYMYIF